MRSPEVWAYMERFRKPVTIIINTFDQYGDRAALYVFMMLLNDMYSLDHTWMQEWFNLHHQIRAESKWMQEQLFKDRNPNVSKPI